jgi:hypothetical protein
MGSGGMGGGGGAGAGRSGRPCPAVTGEDATRSPPAAASTGERGSHLSTGVAQVDRARE